MSQLHQVIHGDPAHNLFDMDHPWAQNLAHGERIADVLIIKDILQHSNYRVCQGLLAFAARAAKPGGRILANSHTAPQSKMERASWAAPSDVVGWQQYNLEAPPFSMIRIGAELHNGVA